MKPFGVLILELHQKKGELYYMNTNIKLKETSACKV